MMHTIALANTCFARLVFGYFMERLISVVLAVLLLPSTDKAGGLYWLCRQSLGIPVLTSDKYCGDSVEGRKGASEGLPEAC
jgi:hypothetical protein